MKPIVIIHEVDKHEYAQKLCYFLTVSGIDTLLSCDVFTENGNYENILSNSSVFIVIASPKLLTARLTLETVHEVKALNKAIFVTDKLFEEIPSWFSDLINLSSNTTDKSRDLNLLLERLKKFVHIQPAVIHPRDIGYYLKH